MAIVRVPEPNIPPTETADWEKLVNITRAIALATSSPLRIIDNVIPKGAVFMIGGTCYQADADTTPSGTVSNYIKLTPSVDGSICTASYISNLTGVSWNSTYNGWYDTSGNAYIFDEILAKAYGVISSVYSARDIDFSRADRIALCGGIASNAGDVAILGIALDGVAIGPGSDALSGISIGKNVTNNFNKINIGNRIGFFEISGELESLGATDVTQDAIYHAVKKALLLSTSIPLSSVEYNIGVSGKKYEHQMYGGAAPHSFDISKISITSSVVTFYSLNETIVLSCTSGSSSVVFPVENVILRVRRGLDFIYPALCVV